jgi:Domain of unknown function (DUF4153)
VGNQTRLGLLALGGAVLLGLCGDLLLRAGPWGINAPLWILLLVVGVAVLARLGRLPLLGEARWLTLAAVVFAAGIAWRASPVMIAVNILAVLLMLGLAGHRARVGWPRIGGLLDYVIAYVSSIFHAMGGVLILTFVDVRWQEVPRTGSTRIVLAVLRGLLIAIPLLLLFGALFMAADAVFSGLVSNVFAINVQEVVAHIFWIGLWTWITAGFLRQVLFCTIGTEGTAGVGNWLTEGSPATEAARAADAESAAVDATSESGAVAVAEASAPTPPLAPSTPPRVDGRAGLLGSVELVVVLGLLDLLFLSFVLVQFRYLFGGAELVEVSPTLTYAEYARRGFFELVWVAALLLPIMLTIDWLAKLDRPRDVRLYRALAGALVVLLFVVIASALFRMSLYTQEFGLTELRLYTTAFMGWISLVAIWYLATVLRERRSRFMFGAFVAGMLVAVVLNVVNPDDLIVRTNAARADASSRFDGDYTSQLSADSVPRLIEALPRMPQQEQRTAANRLLRRWRPPESVDWRTWNYGRWRAWEAVGANEAELRVLAGWPPTGEPPPSRSSRAAPSGRGDWLEIPTPD